MAKTKWGKDAWARVTEVDYLRSHGASAGDVQDQMKESRHEIRQMLQDHIEAVEEIREALKRLEGYKVL